jgi:preprotein translocase subunit SecE
MTSTASARPRGLRRVTQFLREVKRELRLVNWPTSQQVATYTTVVLVFVTVLATIVSGMDLGFTKLVLLVFG